VTIKDSVVENLGSGELIHADAGAQVTVERVTGNGGEGRFFVGDNVKAATIRNNTLSNTGGIYFLGAQAGATILVTKNKQRNLQTPPGLVHSSFCQFDKVTTATIDVSWNEVINTFGQSETSGDMISAYKSAYAKIHDNYIQGAYASTAGGSHPGSGIMIDEVGSHDNEVYSNQIVDTTNAGIGISAGSNNKVHDNRLVFDGKLDDGTTLAAANVGVYVWNYYNDGVWANNEGWGNTVGGVNATGQRNDWWTPDCAGRCSNTPLAGALDHAKEVAEYQLWLNKLGANGISIGA
jgi:hypothetical protein